MRDRVKAIRAHRFALFAVFGAFSLCAVAIGAYTCAISGVPSALWLRNLVAWAVGGLAGFALARTFRPALLHIALWLAPLGLLATYFSPAQEHVHRWIDIGPLHINAAMLLLPSMVVALAALAERYPWIWIAPFLSLVLLMLQPDASQATTLAVVMIAIAAAASSRPLLRFAVIIGAAALATFSWLRIDPLQPVPEVEDIIELAYAISPVLAFAALIALLATAIGADVVMRYQHLPRRIAAWALTACFLCWVATTYFGAYPVPWVGIGLSPIIGAWLGVGLLVGLRRDVAAA